MWDEATSGIDFLYELNPEKPKPAKIWSRWRGRSPSARIVNRAANKKRKQENGNNIAICKELESISPVYQYTCQNTNDITTQTQARCVDQKRIFFFIKVKLLSHPSACEQVSQVLLWNHKPIRHCVTHPSLPSSRYLCLCPYTYEIHGCQTQMLSLCSCFGASPRNHGTRPHKRLSFQRHPNIPIQYRLHSYFFYTAPPPPAPFHTHIYKHSHTDKSGLSLLALELALLIRPHCVNSTVPVLWPSPPLFTAISTRQVCRRQCIGFKQQQKKSQHGL